MGHAREENGFEVLKSKLASDYINMGNGLYGVSLRSTFDARIANQGMVIKGNGFDFGIGEGTAVVDAGTGHGGRFQIYQPHQFIISA